MVLQILVDNKNSWIVPFAQKLSNDFQAMGFQCSLIHEQSKIEVGDILFLLSCEQIVPAEQLKKHTHNLVVHESFLPQGKGWSPVTWQILEGKKQIPVTLLEAGSKVDSGKIYYQEIFELNGTELIDEVREKQANATSLIAKKFVHAHPDNIGKTQEGAETFYKKRTPKDSELDPKLSLEENFNLLRVCDNERYPAFFYKDGVKYILKIYKDPGEMK